MSEISQGRGTPVVGTLSADGSRMWDGRFWVPLRPDNPLDQLPPPVVRRFESEPLWERRGFGPGGIILAAIVGVVLTYMPIPLPAPGSIEGALNEMAIAQTIRGLVTFVALVVILSIGRQGIDVLLLRAMVVAFFQGAAFGVLLPIWMVRGGGAWLIFILIAGLIWAVLVGPVLALFAILANLFWYRSVRSLRPQLGIFNRGSKRVSG